MIQPNLQQSGYQTYKHAAVETAAPDKLLIMLFQGGIKFLKQAEIGLERKDFEQVHNNLIKVQDILTELIQTLDMQQGEIAENLFRLYDFYRTEVFMANIKKDPEKIKAVLEFFIMFRDMWTEAALKVRASQSAS